MINSNVGTPIQAYPLKTTTQIFTSAVTGIEVKSPLIVHMQQDGDIVLHYNSDATPAQKTINAVGGSDWAISDNFDSIDVSAACIITPA